MPRIWADSIDLHRRQVQDAILDATAELLAERGPTSVAMSTIADRVGIGRATLYKYFPDVDSILLAWHARAFGDRLAQLTLLADGDSATLDDVLAFVRRQRARHHAPGAVDVVGTVAHAVAGHRGAMPDAVEGQVMSVLGSVVGQLANRGEIRSDLPVESVARWLLHAIHAPVGIHDEALIELLADSVAPGRARFQRSGGTMRASTD